MTKQWYKTVVKSKAESPWAYVVSKLEGDKRRNRIHLKDACIPKVVPNTQPNPKGSVARKPPSVLVVLKPPGGTGLPKYVLRSVSNPSANSAVGKGIPNTGVNNAVGNQSPIHSVNSGVQNSGIQNSVNSVQDQEVQNKAVNTNQEQKEVNIKSHSIPIVDSVPSSYNVPKLELRKDTNEKSSEPNNPTENGDNNKIIPKVSAPTSSCPKSSVLKNITIRRAS